MKLWGRFRHSRTITQSDPDQFMWPKTLLMRNKPTAADIAKIHAEINQCMNQRLTLLTATITLFGVAMGWVVGGLASRQAGAETIQVQPVSLLLPAAFFIALIVMLDYYQAILRQMHVLSAYLVLTRSSAWELHYQEFAKDPDVTTQDYRPLLVFGAVGFLALLIPSSMVALFRPANDGVIMRISFVAFIASAASFGCFWWIVWRARDYSDYRNRVMRRWKKVLPSNVWM
jgi:hypothetical protein